MRKLLIATLLMKLVCLQVLCQPLSVLAESGSGGGAVDECAGDPTKYSLDANGDETVDISDVILSLTWMFSGGQVPQVCLDSTDLEASLATAEGERDAALADLGTAEAALSGSFSRANAFAWGVAFVETNTEGYDEYTHNASGIRFVLLPGGSFEMGSPEDEEGRRDHEGPVHTVILRPFLIAKYEVTQAEYAAVMTGNTAGLNATPSGNFGDAAASDQRPVEQVSWDDLHLNGGFLERTGLVLPSEAQWEYACRAGTSGPYAGNGVLDDMGWYVGNGDGSTHDVGGKQANQFGLHDMHGNVWEWCSDIYDHAFYGKGLAGFVDPISGYRACPAKRAVANRRVIRGGGSLSPQSGRCASALRTFQETFERVLPVGFRPAMPLH